MKDKIFLLSTDEAKKLPEEILKSNNWWWLRSHGGFQNCVVVVYPDGLIDIYGNYVYYRTGNVRPAIKFDSKEEIFNLPKTKNGKYIIYLGKKWIDITEYIGFPCLLKKKPFKMTRRFDLINNDYETSEIRKWLLNWYYHRKVYIEVKNAFVKHFKEEVEKMLSEDFFDSRSSGRVEIEVQKNEIN